MALNKANMTWSCKQIAKMAGNGTFVFDNIIQRSYVWEQTRKSNLIHSLIEGFPVPPFYAKKVDGRVYDFLDGKQRIDAIRGFIENEYYLIGVPEITYTGADGNEKTEWADGKYFKDLPEELQDAIKDYHLTVYYYEDITPEQVRMLFSKLNNGKPLSTKERNIANCVDIITVSDIGKHELFKNTMTEKALATRKQIPIIMKMWMMLNEDIDDVSFESKTFNEVMQETKMTDAERDEVVSVIDKIYATYKALEEYDNARVAKSVMKKMVSETHMVSLVPWFKQAIDEEISDKLMADFMVELFGNGVTVSAEYSDACKSGSAKNDNIKRRNNEIEKAWDRFFDDVEESKEEEKENKLVPMPGLDLMEEFYNGDDSSDEWGEKFRNDSGVKDDDFINEPEEVDF